MNIEYFSFFSNTGYGNSSLGYIEALNKLNFNLKINSICKCNRCKSCDIPWASESQKKLLKKSFDGEPDFVFLHCTPDFFKKHKELANTKGKIKTFGFGTYEIKNVPPMWGDELNVNCTDVIVPSEFCRKIFSHTISKPIHVVPHIVNENYFMTKQNGEEKEFTILAVATWTQRKNWIELIKGCVLAMKSGYDFRLLMKVHGVVNVEKKILKDIAEHVPENLRNKFVYIFSDMKVEETAKLHSYANAFICASRGEGFCIPIAEAMASETPIISSLCGSLSDLVNHENATIIESEGEEKVTLDTYPHEMWPVVPAKNIQRAIVELMSNYKTIQSTKTPIAKQKATNLYSLQSVSEKLKNLLTF